jgi:ankyrin repeat protein
MYQDEFQVYELLDRWNTVGPPVTEHVVALFQQKPAAAKREFAYGQTLLHKCVQNYSNHLDLVKVFLNAYPEALLKQDNDGCMPIHRALTAENRTPSLELVRLLIFEAPDSILEPNSAGEYPLHLACQRQCHVSVIQFLMDCFPDVVQYRDRAGAFPLDHALMMKEKNCEPDSTVLQILLKKHSVLLSFIDNDGSLPLHRILSRNHKRFDSIVDILTDYCPGALRFQDDHGQTPLLQACSDNNSLSQIFGLIRKWPEQVTTQSALLFYETSFNGELLPSALSSKSSRLNRVQEWIQLHPEVLLCPDQQGRLPIHYAAVSQSNEALDIVQFLINQSTSSISKVDIHGRLALHYASAVIESTDEDVTNVLIDAYPEGLKHADSDDRLPWHYADCARKSFVFDRTLELYPDLEIELEYVPDEIRWDIVQILPDDLLFEYR